MNNLLARPGIKQGLALGVVLAIIWLLLYFIDYKMLFAGWKAFITVALMITFIVLAIKGRRKDLGGYLKYGNGVVEGLLTASIAAFICVLTAVLIHDVIDPEFHMKAKDISIEKMEEGMSWFGGMNSEMMDDVMEKMEEQDFGVNAMNSISLFFTYSITGLIIALIAAIFIKREPPVFGLEDESVQTTEGQ